MRKESNAVYLLGYQRNRQLLRRQQSQQRWRLWSMTWPSMLPQKQSQMQSRVSAAIEWEMIPFICNIYPTKDEGETGKEEEGWMNEWKGGLPLLRQSQNTQHAAIPMVLAGVGWRYEPCLNGRKQLRKEEKEEKKMKQNYHTRMRKDDSRGGVSDISGAAIACGD